MVGDHIQLPATVFFPNASQTKYNRSLFERLIDNNFPHQILDIQYRMETTIRSFVGQTFYSDVLKDSHLSQKKINDCAIYKILDRSLNFSFFHLENSHEKFCNFTKSYYNETESEAIIFLIKSLHMKIDDFVRNKKNYFENFENLNFKIAIIAPYKAQVKYLIEQVDQRIPEYKNIIEINTVDSFQGREQDIVIISCVRSNAAFSSAKANKKENIGFLNDFRRMNVALSRAKYACFVIGDYFTLEVNEYWNKLIAYCKKISNFFIIEKQFINSIRNKYDFFALLKAFKSAATLDNKAKSVVIQLISTEDNDKVSTYKEASKSRKNKSVINLLEDYEEEDCNTIVNKVQEGIKMNNININNNFSTTAAPKEKELSSNNSDIDTNNIPILKKQCKNLNVGSLSNAVNSRLITIDQPSVDNLEEGEIYAQADAPQNKGLKNDEENQNKSDYSSDEPVILSMKQSASLSSEDVNNLKSLKLLEIQFYAKALRLQNNSDSRADNNNNKNNINSINVKNSETGYNRQRLDFANNIHNNEISKAEGNYNYLKTNVIVDMSNNSSSCNGKKKLEINITKQQSNFVIFPKKELPNSDTNNLLKPSPHKTSSNSSLNLNINLALDEDSNTNTAYCSSSINSSSNSNTTSNIQNKEKRNSNKNVNIITNNLPSLSSINDRLKNKTFIHKNAQHTSSSDNMTIEYGSLSNLKKDDMNVSLLSRKLLRDGN